VKRSIRSVDEGGRASIVLERNSIKLVEENFLSSA